MTLGTSQTLVDSTQMPTLSLLNSMPCLATSGAGIVLWVACSGGLCLHANKVILHLHLWHTVFLSFNLLYNHFVLPACWAMLHTKVQPGAMMKPKSDTMKYPISICDRHERLMALSQLIFAWSLLCNPHMSVSVLFIIICPPITMFVFIPS